MKEQGKEPSDEEKVDGANSTKKLAGIAATFLYKIPDFIAKAGASAYFKNPWVGIEKNDVNFLIRFAVKETETGSLKVLRIDRKEKGLEVVRSAQFIYKDSDHKNSFEGLSYIEGIEKAEMLYPEEGSYMSDYKDPPLLDAEAEQKAKDLIKTLI